MATLRLTIMLMLLAIAGGACAAQSTALQSFYNKVDTLQAHFQQTMVDEDGTVVQKASGSFLLQRPGKFRWEYDTPYQQIIVSDGDMFRFYDVDLAQVTVRSIGTALQSTPAALLTGGAALDKQFKITVEGAHDGLNWIRLLPKASDSDFKEIRMGLLNGVPRRMQMHDQLGQTTNIKFSDITVNESIPASAFKLEVPNNVDIVHAD